MKTTLDLPDDLMRAVKIRAAERNIKLKQLVADALRAALAAPVAGGDDPVDPVQAFGRRLVFLSDGSVVNPLALDDASFFEALESQRAASRLNALQSPFEPR